MKIRYIVPFKRPIIVDDHWEIPIQGGRLRVLEQEGFAKALELTFENQPLEYAMRIKDHPEGQTKMTITGHDKRLIFVKKQLEDAATFLECIYDLELNTDEIKAEYESETPDEDAEIAIKGFSTKRRTPTLPLSFDMLTRALMASEKNDGPKFEATLVKTARNALAEQEFINSFRYSFLLIESLYGEGQFKKAGLQAVLKANQEFRVLVESAIQDAIPAKNDRTSDTAKLLEANPEVDQVIDHLVDKRGFYFHGNIKRKDAWKPDDQGKAESLALLAMGIVSKISFKAADLIFQPEFEQRHFEDAMRAGAKIVYQINFKFRELEEKFERQQEINIAMAGTKPTARTALAVTQKFLQLFEENLPSSALLKAECIEQRTGQKVFDLTFHLG